MFEEISGLRMAQADGDLPTVAAGRAPGESSRATCRGGFGAFTAFRRLSLGFDRQNSRNLHDPSPSSP